MHCASVTLKNFTVKVTHKIAANEIGQNYFCGEINRMFASFCYKYIQYKHKVVVVICQ